VVLFRAEIEVGPKYLESEFYFDFELYFSDVTNLGGPEAWQQHVEEFQ
jgi:hypothetical protein